jgi:hypothetical protein
MIFVFLYIFTISTKNSSFFASVFDHPKSTYPARRFRSIKNSCSHFLKRKSPLPILQIFALLHNVETESFSTAYLSFLLFCILGALGHLKIFSSATQVAKDGADLRAFWLFLLTVVVSSLPQLPLFVRLYDIIAITNLRFFLLLKRQVSQKTGLFRDSIEKRSDRLCDKVSLFI